MSVKSNDPKKVAASQAEAERYFTVRSRRAVRGQAKAILVRSGTTNPPRDHDGIDEG